jgi:rod shape-determining protein MreD
MRLVFTALAALAAALIEVSVAPHFSVGDAHPNPVLVLGVIASVAFRAETGLAWAFAGGIALDVLTGRPVGATAFALTIALGAALLVARSAPRIRLLAAIGLVPLCSGVSSAVLAVVLVVLAAPVAAPDPLALVAGVTFDAVIGLVVAPLVLTIVDRRAQAGHVYG